MFYGDNCSNSFQKNICNFCVSRREKVDTNYQKEDLRGRIPGGGGGGGRGIFVASNLGNSCFWCEVLEYRWSLLP
jgi:hypothetical protein